MDELAQLDQVYKSTRSAAPQQQKKGPGGLRGFALNFLPTVLGGAGAVAGTLAGPVGTVAGGAAGAGLGEYLRQKLSGEADDGIDKGNLVQEGVFGAVPGVFKGIGAVKGAVKGGKGARGAIAAMTKSEKALKAGKSAQSTEQAMLARKGLISKTGEAMSRTGGGLKVGKNVGDVEKLDNLSQVAAKYSGTPKTQLRKISTDMGKLDEEVSTLLSKNPIKINGKDVGGRIQSAIDDPNMFTELDLGSSEAQRALQMHVQKFSTSKSAKDVNDYVKVLNKTAVRAKDKLSRGVNLTGKENAALAAKHAGDDVLKEFPEIAPLKQQMAQLFDINPQIAAEAERGFSIPMMGGSKIKAPYQAIRGAQSYGGAGLQKAAEAVSDIPGVSKTGGIVGKVAKASIPQAGYRAGASLAFGTPFVGNQQPEQLPEDPSMTDPSMDMGMPEEVPEASNSPFAPENVESNIEKILAGGGTMKDVSEYMNIAKTMASFSPKAEKPMSATAAKAQAGAQAGLENLDYLDQIMKEQPSDRAKTAIPGRGVLSGLGNRALGTDDYEAARQNIIDSWARIKTGAAISSNEERRFKENLPQAFDSDRAVQMKMTTLRNLFSSVAGNAGGSGIDLEALEGQE